MELRVLRYFLTVAMEENITHAAEILHVTQPTLSRQLAQLEADLGVTLFRRGNHRITLTEEGQLLRCRAREILELADKAEAELTHMDQVVTGTIAIGCGETGSIRYLADTMADFRKNIPASLLKSIRPLRTTFRRAWTGACSIWAPHGTGRHQQIQFRPHALPGAVQAPGAQG